MLGVILALVAAILYGTSSALQKYAISKMTAKKKFSFRRMLTNKKWFLSTFIGLIGGAFYVLAMRYAPLSVVQVFLALSIVIPILAGFAFFKEKLYVREWVCVALIVLGVFLTVL